MTDPNTETIPVPPPSVLAPSLTDSLTDEGDQVMMRPGETHSVVLERERGLVTNADWDLLEAPDDETMIINMGPQHPATHGVLRLMLELDGEQVLRVKPIIGYLHTGMEKTAEELMYVQGSTNVTRMDYVAPMSNELCFSLAVEQLLGVEIPERAQMIRVMMAELTRLNSHLVWLATTGLDLGGTTVMIQGFNDREPIVEFFEDVCGLRMNTDYIRPGGVAADLPDGWQASIKAMLEDLPKGIQRNRDLLDQNPVFKKRTIGIARITQQEALALGMTGPILRATGIDFDLRKKFPYCGYENFEFDTITEQDGDAYSRYIVRIAEMYESLRIIEQCLENMPDGDYRSQDKKVTPPPRHRINVSMEALIHHFKLYTEGFKVEPGETYVGVEGPKGETGCYMVADGTNKPYRQHTRGSCFLNVHALPTMMVGGMIADAIVAIASIDPILGEVDR